MDRARTRIFHASESAPETKRTVAGGCAEGAESKAPDACRYWADGEHAFMAIGYRFKMCQCGAFVKERVASAPEPLRSVEDFDHE